MRRRPGRTVAWWIVALISLAAFLALAVFVAQGALVRRPPASPGSPPDVIVPVAPTEQAR